MHRNACSERKIWKEIFRVSWERKFLFFWVCNASNDKCLCEGKHSVRHEDQFVRQIPAFIDDTSDEVKDSKTGLKKTKNYEIPSGAWFWNVDHARKVHSFAFIKLNPAVNLPFSLKKNKKTTMNECWMIIGNLSMIWHRMLNHLSANKQWKGLG